MKVRIGIDARMARPTPSGLGRYAVALTGALMELDAPQVDWVIIKHPDMAGQSLSGGRAEEVTIPGELDQPENLRSGGAIDRLHLDIYHSLHHFLPARLHTPRVVVTLHDLIWVEHAHLSYYGLVGRVRAEAVRLWGTATMRHALKRSHAVVSISEASRRDALRRYRFLKPGAIHTVHHGVDHAQFPPRSGPEPEEPYLFALGNSRPYKNILRTVEAFSQVARTHPRVRLVVTGRGDSADFIRKRAEAHGVGDRVDLTGLVTDQRIVELFHGARGLAFPSIIEGFGFPVIESMALGCPVIVSDIPVLREIAGDAAITVDPLDTADIARGMTRLLDNADLRQKLREAGLARAQAFQWRTCAEKTFAVYRTLHPGL